MGSQKKKKQNKEVKKFREEISSFLEGRAVLEAYDLLDVTELKKIPSNLGLKEKVKS